MAAVAAYILPKYTYYYQKKEAVENGIKFNIFGKFLIQTSQNTDGTITVIEARTSLSKIAAVIPPFPVDLIENAYGHGTNIDDIVTATDLNDLEFKEFLNTLNPIIKLPVEKGKNRFFTRALVATTDAIDTIDEIDAKDSTDMEVSGAKDPRDMEVSGTKGEIEPTDMEFSQNIGLSPNQEEFPPFFEAINTFEPINIDNPIRGYRPKRYKLDDINPKYIETTEDDIIKKSKRLLPIVIKKIPRNIKEFKSAYTLILNKKLYDVNSARTTNIIEMINDKFAEHINFSYPFFQNSIRANNADRYDIPESPATVSLLDTINVDDPNFIIINFLRSYIDLYHDVLHHGKKYCDKLKVDFEKKLPADDNREFYNKWIGKIDSEVDGIFTKSRKISQSQCKKLIEELADDFINMLHSGKIGMKEGVGVAAAASAAAVRAPYTLIPKNKENANIMSASIDNQAELKKLFDTMKGDGINGFFVESIDNNIGTQILHKGFDLCSLTLGEWDAGSGYNGGKEIINSRILIGPEKAVESLGKELLNIHRPKARVAAGAAGAAGAALNLTKIYIPNEPINIFNTINISVSDDNNILTVQSDDKKFTITDTQELSLNKLFITIDDTVIRGSQSKKGKIGPIKTNPQINIHSNIDLKKSLISLKTWTDLIQIVTISKSMTPLPDRKPLKILTVINDNLCETTARMYGLGHVLKSQNKIVTYYNYNINSRNLTDDQLKAKMKLKLYITTHKEMFIDYITKWFNQRIKALEDIHRTFYDPVLYFISELFKDIYTEARNKALKILSEISTIDVKLIPNSIDEYIESITSSAVLLGDLLNYVSKFNLAIEIITKLNSRLPIDIFFEAYDYVEQQISNTFKDAEPHTLRAMIASTFAFVFIKQYNPSRYELMLEGFKESTRIEKRLNDINDIITAYNTLSKLEPLTNSNGNIVRNNSSNYNYPLGNGTRKRKALTTMDIITYTYYIREIVYRPFIKILPDWAFSEIIEKVKAKLVKAPEAGAAVAAGAAGAAGNNNSPMSGGNKRAKIYGYLHRTHKRKYKKHIKHRKQKTHKKR
jgi:hypothetical protein